MELDGITELFGFAFGSAGSNPPERIGGIILKDGGAGRDRTDDPRLARAVLSQLSYSPTVLISGYFSGKYHFTTKRNYMCLQSLSRDKFQQILLRCWLSSRSPISHRNISTTHKDEGWWAWEDLNFRPYAYQAYALTS